MAVGAVIAAVIVGGKNTALEKANAVAVEKRDEAEQKQELAVAAARAANEQNRDLVDAQIELVRLLDGKLRDVPAIQGEREEIHDRAIRRLKATAQAMTRLRRDVDWDPKDKEKNWRSLARALRHRPG